MPANAILIVGESGSGKSTSMESLNPSETFIINVSAKSLPFRGWKGKYKEFSGANPTGNLVNTDDADTIIKTMKYVSDKRPEIKYLIIDDSQYVAANEYMRRAKEVGFTKFTEIAQKMQNQVIATKSLRDDLYVFMMSHMDTNDEGKMSAKTIGKMMNNVITYEGMFTIVLYTFKREMKNGTEYGFTTNGDPNSTAKSPRGMFEKEMPNDLSVVVEGIKKYEEG